MKLIKAGNYIGNLGAASPVTGQSALSLLLPVVDGSRADTAKIDLLLVKDLTLGGRDPGC